MGIFLISHPFWDIWYPHFRKPPISFTLHDHLFKPPVICRATRHNQCLGGREGGSIFCRLLGMGNHALTLFYDRKSYNLHPRNSRVVTANLANHIQCTSNREKKHIPTLFSNIKLTSASRFFSKFDIPLDSWICVPGYKLTIKSFRCMVLSENRLRSNCS